MYFLHLVTFFTIAYFIMPGFGNDDDPFKLEYNDNIMALIKNMPENPGDHLKSQFLYTISPDDRIQYCNKAKDFAGLDVVTLITNAPLKLLGSVYQDVLIECRTVPISYIRGPEYTSSGKKMIIMMFENIFLKYHFEVQITKSEPTLYLESTDNPLKCNRRLLPELEERDALKLCIAAKKYLHQLNDSNNNAQKEPEWQNDRVEPAQLFDFGEEIGKHFAMNCPIAPSMYVYANNLAADNKDVVIVLVQDE